MWFKQIQGHWRLKLATAEQGWTLTPALSQGPLQRGGKHWGQGDSLISDPETEDLCALPSTGLGG